jgi:hypothetical protein
MKTTLPVHFCSYEDKTKETILHYCHDFIGQGGTILFKEKEFKNYDKLKKYLEQYCTIEVPKMEHEIMGIIKLWIEDHPSFLENK